MTRFAVLREKKSVRDPDFKKLHSLPAKRSLGHDVYESLKRAILSGDLSPGDRMVESRVASALGISRTPVREAIHKLEREGFLKHNPTGGFFVVGLTREDIVETFGIRSVLESYAAKLATAKHTKDDLQILKDKVHQFQRYLERGETDQLARINTEFHHLLYGLSNSPRLIKMINQLSDQIYRFRRVILEVEDMAKQSHDDHRQMIFLMEKRDEKGVEETVKEHIQRGKKIVLEEFEKHHPN
jgi:DNA-binding GntR family transcriptional regulator